MPEDGYHMALAGFGRRLPYDSLLGQLAFLNILNGIVVEGFMIMWDAGPTKAASKGDVLDSFSPMIIVTTSNE
jgi:hypothetical protein